VENKVLTSDFSSTFSTAGTSWEARQHQITSGTHPVQVIQHLSCVVHHFIQGGTIHCVCAALCSVHGDGWGGFNKKCPDGDKYRRDQVRHWRVKQVN
jgi:hypothetical protein